MIAQFPDDSRVWIYTSNRIISNEDQSEIGGKALLFLEGWASHGTPLTATVTWLNPYQLGIVLDQSKAGASGCSIDKQTRFMREIGEEFHIDWFDRLWMIVQTETGFERISFFDLGKYADAKLCDPLLQTLGELRNNWPIAIQESRYKQLI